jgi:hypothetical protein
MGTAPIILSLIWFSGGCGTWPDGRRWGGDVTPFPRGNRLKKAAPTPLLDPGTWVPVVGACSTKSLG